MNRSPMPARRGLMLSACALLTACASQAVIPPAPKASASIDVPAIKRPEGETPQWWFRNGAAQAAQASAQAGAGGQQAKNVIVFLGDGNR